LHTGLDTVGQRHPPIIAAKVRRAGANDRRLEPAGFCQQSQRRNTAVAIAKKAKTVGIAVAVCDRLFHGRHHCLRHIEERPLFPAGEFIGQAWEQHHVAFCGQQLHIIGLEDANLFTRWGTEGAPGRRIDMHDHGIPPVSFPVRRQQRPTEQRFSKRCLIFNLFPQARR
tara:strand:+ start:2853 stop:3359 length:507 start_codon:yes stop_codon:yes gene_type:complete